MYATIRAYQGNTELADVIVENEDAVRSLISGIDGFHAYFVIKLGEGTTTVSVFDTEAGATESAQAAAGWLEKNVPDMSATPYVTTGEVVVNF